jgi:hypothetical protein
MKNLAISLLLIATAAAPALAQQAPQIRVAATSDSQVDGGRVRTPNFPGGPVVLGGQRINLSAKGEGCSLGAGDGWFVKQMAPYAYFAGCWTQQGHIIKIETHLSVYDGVRFKAEKYDVVDVPDAYY